MFVLAVALLTMAGSPARAQSSALPASSPGATAVIAAKERPDASVKRNPDIAAEDARLEAGTSCVGMRLTNKGKTLDALLKAETSIGKAVLISQMMHQDVARIEVYPEKPTVLQPGGLCVLVRGVKVPLKAGEHFDITLSFEKAEATRVSVLVTAPEEVPASAPTTSVAKPAAAGGNKSDAPRGPTEAKTPETRAPETKTSGEKHPDSNSPDSSVTPAKEPKPEPKTPEEKQSEAPAKEHVAPEAEPARAKP